jgi:hypothetical protein
VCLHGFPFESWTGVSMLIIIASRLLLRQEGEGVKLTVRNIASSIFIGFPRYTEVLGAYFVKS